MNITRFIAAAALTLSGVGALAADVTFSSNAAPFSSGLISTQATSFSSTFTFSGLSAGTYDVLGTISGQNLMFTSISLDSHSWTVFNNTPYHFAGVQYTGTQPLSLTVSGTKGANAAGVQFSGELSVTPVPEPETFAMLLVGMGLVGWVARRRSARAALAV